MNLQLAGAWVLHERAREHYYSGSGPYSIKWFPRGSARYRVRGGTHRVDATSFLVLNDGEDYTIEIEEDTESFCVFFDRATIVDAAGRAPEWITRTHRAAGSVLQQLTRVRDDESVLDLANALVALLGDEQRDIDALAAARASTKRELYRRAHVARDYIEASASEPVPLAEIARVAALSPNHLLRTFRTVFGRSPHQYLTDVRLARARALLARGMSVTDVCFACGFESLGSFSTLFKRRFGVPPSLSSRAKSRDLGGGTAL